MKTLGTSQNAILLDLLQNGHAVTRVTAMSLGIMNLTARLSELKAKGHDIRCEWKKDAIGRDYGSFYLVAPSTGRGWASAHLVSSYSPAHYAA